MTFNYLVCSYFKDDKKEPFLQEEFFLKEPNLEEIRKILGLEEGYEFTDMYEISLEQQDYFSKKFDINFDFSTYQYFFEVQI